MELFRFGFHVLGGQGLADEMAQETFRGHSTFTGGAGGPAALAADTAFSHVLGEGEGIAAAPWRPRMDRCGLHAISSLAA